MSIAADPGPGGSDWDRWGPASLYTAGSIDGQDDQDGQDGQDGLEGADSQDGPGGGPEAGRSSTGAAQVGAAEVGAAEVGAAEVGAEAFPPVDAQWSTTTYSGPRRHRPGHVLSHEPVTSVGAEPAGVDVYADDAYADGYPDYEDAADSYPDDEPMARRVEKGLLSSSRTMAIASLASRLTGFLRTIAITAALGLAASKVADSYNLANMLPNMVYELLLGGVLSSVVIPLLVNAQEHDEDGGEAYTHRLLSWSVTVLGVATLLAVAAAPLLAAAFSSQHAQRDLISLFATLLLPEIFFYGLGAMFTAILNTRSVYGPPAWAPVLNNLITIGTVVVFALLPGPSVLNEHTITNAQVLVLGIGTTLGIVVQALVLIPFLRRTGFRWQWRFRPSGAETVRMREIGGLGGWVLGYVAVSQAGLYVVSRIAVASYQGGVSTFAAADLLFQVPYGIVGVSLLTALMPRMSRSAAHGDQDAVIADLSLGARLSTVGLLPITGALIALGPTITVVLFSYGRSDATDGRLVGILLGIGAFGLVPFALVMLQLRVFYALRDARTPTLINVFMIITKVSIVVGAYLSFHDGRTVLAALTFGTSMSYLVGAVVGHLLLRRRFGGLDFSAVAQTFVKVLIATVVASFVAYFTAWGTQIVLGSGTLGSAASVIVGVLAAVPVLVVIMRATRVRELSEIAASVRRG